uniref:Enoyl reductase (ER) domain-containing protein n=1 Tax=Lygus hesperus TaxID=30085 RepID=A0A0K8SED3_LYGHE
MRLGTCFNHHLLRYVFTDDSFLNVKSYSSQIQKDLKVNIKLSGEWGTLRQLPVDLNEEMAPDDVCSGMPVFPLSEVAPSREITALGLNLNDITGPTEDGCLRIFDYATSKIMGLAVFNPVSKTFTKDEIFKWKRPATWSDKEAASVPMMYVLASYIVHLANNPSDGSSILVNRGLIPLSQALISISLSENIQTFVTVYGNDEKKTLMEIFPNLEDRNIFDCSKSTFYIDLLLRTQGKGVYKVVNTFTEDAMIEACVKSTGVLGTYIQVSMAPMIKNSKIGMLLFRDEVIALGATINIVMDLEKEHKVKIRDFVQNALNSGHAKPFTNLLSIPSHSHNAEAVCLLKNAKSKVVVDLKPNLKGSNSKTFVCDSSSNYVVIGGQPQTEFWLKLTEWLLRRGARRVNVVLTQPNLSTALSMRLQTLQESYPTSRIHLHSTKQISSKACIEHFVNDIESAASLSTIFVLSSAVKDYSESLHQVLQNKGVKCGLVCLGNGAERLCERWKKEGCTSLCVRCSPAVLDNYSFLQHLDELIINSKKNAVVTVNRYSLQHRKYQEKTGTEWNHVPTSLPELHELLRLSSSKPTFVEVQSRTTRREQAREIDPVFVIPGLRFNHARRIAERLYFPTFIARLPSDVVDIEFMASDLAQQMSEMPQNMFTLIADEWGGTLALHIASKLQILGKVATAVLLEAAPATTSNWAAKLMSDDEALLKNYIKLTPKVQLRLRECSSWESKIDIILENSVDKTEMRKTLQALSLLRNRLKGVLRVKPPARKIKFICNLFRYGQALKSDQCSLKEYLQKKAIIHVREVDSMLAMIDQAIDEINSIVLFEYKDAAYRQEDNTIGIGFSSTTRNNLPALTCIHSVHT